MCSDLGFCPATEAQRPKATESRGGPPPACRGCRTRLQVAGSVAWVASVAPVADRGRTTGALTRAARISDLGSLQSLQSLGRCLPGRKPPGAGGPDANCRASYRSDPSDPSDSGTDMPPPRTRSRTGATAVPSGLTASGPADPAGGSGRIRVQRAAGQDAEVGIVPVVAGQRLTQVGGEHEAEPYRGPRDGLGSRGRAELRQARGNVVGQPGINNAPGLAHRGEHRADAGTGKIDHGPQPSRAL